MEKVLGGDKKIKFWHEYFWKQNYSTCTSSSSSSSLSHSTTTTRDSRLWLFVSLCMLNQIMNYVNWWISNYMSVHDHKKCTKSTPARLTRVNRKIVIFCNNSGNKSKLVVSIRIWKGQAAPESTKTALSPSPAPPLTLTLPFHIVFFFSCSSLSQSNQLPFIIIIIISIP